MTELRLTIQETMEHKREVEWRNAGISEGDIEFSRLCGIDGRDILTLRQASSAGLLIVVRCPKLAARAWHGLLPPKPWAVKEKTGTSGVAVTPDGEMVVSDYDLMSLYKRAGAGWKKIFASAANGASHGKWEANAVALFVELNKRLVSRLQHGCQDDYQSVGNRGIRADDHFAAFHDGLASHLSTPIECAAFYWRNGLKWPYDASGRYVKARA